MKTNNNDTVVIEFTIIAIMLFFGIGLVAVSVLYWLGIDRSADRFITSRGPMGFMIAYVSPVLGLGSFLTGAGFTLFGDESTSHRHWFSKLIAFLLYCITGVLLFTETTGITNFSPIPIHWAFLIFLGFATLPIAALIVQPIIDAVRKIF